ncbi:MAG: PilN domain-containing protein [Nitrospirota bacterium]
MIKVNLIPVKRKKKAKPIPTFIVTMVIITVIVGIIMAYLTFFFKSRLSTKRAEFAANEKRLSELKEKIKAVENFEKFNRAIQQRTDIIEQLSKNKALPVRILNEINNLVPNGVWLHSVAVVGQSINIDGYAFTNSDIVSYVDNIKNSAMFAEVYLQESKSTDIGKVPLYMFKLTFRIKV